MLHFSEQDICRSDQPHPGRLCAASRFVALKSLEEVMDILVMSGRFVALKSLEEAVERARPRDNQHKLSTPSGHRSSWSLVLY